MIFIVIGLFIVLYLSYRLGTVHEELKQLKLAFSQYQKLSEENEKVSQQFYQEIMNAKIENNNQFNRILSGIGKLQFNTKSNEKTKTGGVANESPSELSKEARQNYYLLRDDLVLKDNMILGLQSYVRNICLK